MVWAKEGALLPQGEALDARFEGRLRQALKEAGLKAGESLLLYTEEGPVLLFGRGEDDRESGGRLAQALQRLAFPEALVEPLEDAYALAEGLLLGAYRFDRLKTKGRKRPSPSSFRAFPRPFWSGRGGWRKGSTWPGTW